MMEIEEQPDYMGRMLGSLAGLWVAGLGLGYLLGLPFPVPMLMGAIATAPVQVWCLRH